MAKLAQNFAKYVIYAKMHAKGIVEKPDVIGAVFGQTEGLLGQDMDLRELQRTGRVGRIEVIIKNNKGNSYADIIIPCSLDASETALIASSLETIEKVGPCDAQIEIAKVEDVRSQKRRYVIERAKEILKAMIEEGMPDSQRMTEMIKEAVRSWEVSEYEGLSCGPDIKNNDEIIVVEGRADVINLLKNGIKNVIAIEGSKIPQAIINLSKEKIVTAFLDGDRGGDLNLKKLLAVAEIDFVARAPEGKEVEELSKKEIYKALREKIPADQVGIEKISEEKEEIESSQIEFFRKLLEELIGTRAAYLVKGQEILTKIPISEIGIVLDEFNPDTIIMDAKINQAIVSLAEKKNINYLIGIGFKEPVQSKKVKILTMKELFEEQ
jgi:DNA primase